jgi:RNA polymerase sigma-70 factor, ECF subfamily
MDDLTSLLVRAGGGDRDALAAFITQAQPDVWRFCAAMLAPGLADDATQETFVRAWRSSPNFRAESSARTWLLTIARRTCLDIVHRRLRADQATESAARQPGAEHVRDHSEMVALTELTRLLEPDRRSAFILTQVLGLSYGDAAHVAGCPVGTIRSRVARARHDLQTALLDIPDDHQSAGPS